MKKIGVMLTLFLLPTLVFAQSFCSDEETAALKIAASEIKVNFSERQDIYPESHYAQPEGTDSDEPVVIYYDYFEIEVLNLTKDFYVVITNTLNGEKLRVNYSDTTNGKYVKKWDDLSKVSTFTFKIHTSKETKCADEELKDLHLTVPRYNSFSSQTTCEGVEGVDVCEKYVTFNELPVDQMLAKAEAAKAKSEKQQQTDIPDMEDIKSFLSKYKNWIYIGVGGIVIIGGLAIVVISKRRRKI